MLSDRINYGTISVYWGWSDQAIGSELKRNFCKIKICLSTRIKFLVVVLEIRHRQNSTTLQNITQPDAHQTLSHFMLLRKRWECKLINHSATRAVFSFIQSAE